MHAGEGEKDAVNSRIVPRAQPGESNMPQGALSLRELGPPKWTHVQSQSAMNAKVGSPPPQNWVGVELDEKWRLFSRKYWENRAIFKSVSKKLYSSFLVWKRNPEICSEDKRAESIDHKHLMCATLITTFQNKKKCLKVLGK